MTRPLLWPLVPVYRLGVALREFQFRSGLKPVRRLRWPVISIGNLSTGGSGKTPLTIALAKALVARGLQVDVLSRGYGRRSTLPLLVDRDGTAEDFGDEPLLIAREAGVPVYVAAERYQAGLLAETASRQVSESAIERGGVHLLDDGFQHRQLARDVDILLLDGRDWAGRLLPAGNLREPLAAIRRATVLALTLPEAPILEKTLRSRGLWQGPVWRLRRIMDVPKIEGPIAAFCGIARPDQFLDGLEKAGLHVASRNVFPDHHSYTAADFDRLVAEARKAGASALVTTEKDRVRMGAMADSISESIPLRTVGLRIEIEDEGAAIDRLVNQVARPRV